MERQINTLCNFTLGFVTCQLPEDMVDVQVQIRPHRGTHTIKEDKEYHFLKFKPWENTPKPFKALQERLSHYIHEWDVDVGAALPVTPNEGKQEKRKGF